MQLKIFNDCLFNVFQNRFHFFRLIYMLTLTFWISLKILILFLLLFPVVFSEEIGASLFSEF